MNTKLEQLRGLAADIGSNVVVHTDTAGSSTYTVDALTFTNIDDAIRHCREVA